LRFEGSARDALNRVSLNHLYGCVKKSLLVLLCYTSATKHKFKYMDRPARGNVCTLARTDPSRRQCSSHPQAAPSKRNGTEEGGARARPSACRTTPPSAPWSPQERC
jgi:hypothetical protein